MNKADYQIYSWRGTTIGTIRANNAYHALHLAKQAGHHAPMVGADPLRSERRPPL